MREIKFRAWNKETKTFGYFELNNYFISGDGCGDYSESHINTWRWKKGALGTMGMYWEFDIDEGEIEDFNMQQYTGLKDKNGKEIYEGDIMRYFNYENVPYYESVDWVVIENSCTDCGTASGFYIRQPTGGEVVGNIHENPELLEFK
jgi:uncharacterized phage protein (TIGR01671 family)